VSRIDCRRPWRTLSHCFDHVISPMIKDAQHNSTHSSMTLGWGRTGTVAARAVGVVTLFGLSCGPHRKGQTLSLPRQLWPQRCQLSTARLYVLARQHPAQCTWRWYRYLRCGVLCV
jgi:hypothetical protein